MSPGQSYRMPGKKGSQGLLFMVPGGGVAVPASKEAFGTGGGSGGRGTGFGCRSG